MKLPIRTFALLLVIASFSTVPTKSLAANFDGDGNSGGTGFFSWWNNWYGDNFPTWNYTTDLEFNYRNQSGITTIQNNSGWLNAKNILIQSTFSGSVTFTDNGGGSGINFKQKLENYSSSAQTWNMNLSGGKDGATVIELNPINGNLTLGGNLYNDDSDDYAVYGANSKTLTLGSTLGVGSTAANVDFSLEQASTVQINANQSWAGTTFVKAGTMNVANNITLATGTLNISGGTFSTSGANVIGNSATVTMSGGNYTLGGSDTVGRLTLSADSIFDFGTAGGSASSFTFGDFNTSAYNGVSVLTINNAAVGSSLVFNVDYTGNATFNSFASKVQFGGAGQFGQISFGGGQTTLLVAIPDARIAWAAGLLCGLIGTVELRRRRPREVRKVRRV